MIAIDAGRVQNCVAQRYLATLAVGQNMDCVETGATLQRRGNLFDAVGSGVQHHHFSTCGNSRNQAL